MMHPRNQTGTANKGPTNFNSYYIISMLCKDAKKLKDTKETKEI